MPAFYKKLKENGEYDRTAIERRNAERQKYYDKTCYAPNHNARWSGDEILLVMQHDYCDMELSRILGRSVRSIQVMRWKQNKKGRR